MTTQTSFLENTVSRPLTDALLYGVHGGLAALVLSGNSYIAADCGIFIATSTLVRGVTAHIFAFLLNKFNYNTSDHQYIYYCTDILAHLAGVFAGALTSLKIIGMVYPVGIFLGISYFAFFLVSENFVFFLVSSERYLMGLQNPFYSFVSTFNSPYAREKHSTFLD